MTIRPTIQHIADQMRGHFFRPEEAALLRQQIDLGDRLTPTATPDWPVRTCTIRTSDNMVHSLHFTTSEHRITDDERTPWLVFNHAGGALQLRREVIISIDIRDAVPKS